MLQHLGNITLPGTRLFRYKPEGHFFEEQWFRSVGSHPPGSNDYEKEFAKFVVGYANISYQFFLRDDGYYEVRWQYHGIIAGKSEVYSRGKALLTRRELNGEKSVKFNEGKNIQNAYKRLCEKQGGLE